MKNLQQVIEVYKLLLTFWPIFAITFFAVFLRACVANGFKYGLKVILRTLIAIIVILIVIAIIAMII